jgi:hypothetical protein
LPSSQQPLFLYTHSGQLRAEAENVICKMCGIVGCGVGQVALKHVHHVADVAVVLTQFCLETSKFMACSRSHGKKSYNEVQSEHKRTLHFQNYTENKCGVLELHTYTSR